jgi:hypothetical protein
VIGGNVVPCDVFSSSLEPEDTHELSWLIKKYTNNGLPEVVSAHFLVESATESYERWQQGVKYLIQNVVSQGYFLMTAIRHASWYRVGEKKVQAVSIDERDIQGLLEENGIVIECIQVLTGSDQEQHGYDGMIFVFGKKSF